MTITCPHCGARRFAYVRGNEGACQNCQRHIPEPWNQIEAYLVRQEIWSARTFGPGRRTVEITKHIQKELAEILAAPHDLVEWIDVIILGLDGFWRAGGRADAIMDYLQAKQNTNFQRTWPAPVEGEPSEHDRTRNAAPAPAASLERTGRCVARSEGGHRCQADAGHLGLHISNGIPWAPRPGDNARVAGRPLYADECPECRQDPCVCRPGLRSSEHW